MPSLKTFGANVMDILFGSRGTPEELALAEAARPPRLLNRVYGVLLLISTFRVLFSSCSNFGWLPFNPPLFDPTFWSWALLGNIVLRFGWEQVEKHYQRRAKARMTPAP